MYDILLRTHTVVAADSTWNSFACSCGSGHVTDHLYCTVTFPTAEDYRSCHHSVSEPREERLVKKMCIMYFQDFLIQLNHFHRYQLESAFFKTRNYFADKATLKAARFEDYKCSFKIV